MEILYIGKTNQFGINLDFSSGIINKEPDFPREKGGNNENEAGHYTF